MPLPATPLIDDFSRADESPLSGNGLWATGDSGFTGTIRILNQATRGSDVNSSMLYVPSTGALGETEVWATVRSTGVSDAQIYARLQGIGGPDTIDGYVLNITTGSCQLQQMTNRTTGNLATGSGSGAVAGDVYVLRVVGYTLTAYRIRAGVVYQFLAATATTKYATGFIGLGFNGGTGATDIANFGGGPLNTPLIFPTHPISGVGAG